MNRCPSAAVLQLTMMAGSDNIESDGRMVSAAGLVVGVLVMVTPQRWSAPLFRFMSLPLGFFLAAWHLCSYTATALGPQEVLLILPIHNVLQDL